MPTSDDNRLSVRLDPSTRNAMDELVRVHGNRSTAANKAIKALALIHRDDMRLVQTMPDGSERTIHLML